MLATAGAIVRLGVACFIDLEPPLGQAGDASFDTTGTLDASPDVPDGATDDAGPECKVDSECVPTGFGSGCLAGRCIAGRCAYSLCPSTGGCAIQRCDVEAGTGACVGPDDPSYYAGSFSVSTNQPFSGLPCTFMGRCVAAAYPFVFVVDGFETVSGYLVADPTEKVPRRITVDRLPVAPAAILANEDRVYFVSKPQGAPASQRISIGWFDVPANPFAATIPVSVVEIPYATTNNAIPTLMPAPDRALYVVAPVANTVALFKPPVAPDATLTPLLPGVANTFGGVLVAPAGGDIAAMADASDGNTTFSLLKNAGTPASGFTPADGVPTTAILGEVAGSQVSVAGGQGNAVVAAAGVGPVVDGSVPEVQKARLMWVVEPGSGLVTAAPAAAIDLKTYSPGFPASARVTTAPALVDGGVVAVYTNQERDASIAQVVVREGTGGNPTPDPARIAVLPGGPGSYVMRASGEWVYAFSNSGTTLTVQILRPLCEAR